MNIKAVIVVVTLVLANNVYLTSYAQQPSSETKSCSSCNKPSCGGCSK